MCIFNDLVNHFLYINDTSKRVIGALVEDKDKFSFSLKRGYSWDELNSFSTSLSIDYPEGSDTIKGFIWYEDGSWSELKTLEGISMWTYHSMPPIPENLL